MTLRQITLAGLLAIVSLIAANQKAFAVDFHTDTLAHRIEQRAVGLYHEFRTHYKHTPEFPHLVSDARSLYRLAKHIRELSHHGSVLHMRGDLRRLDHAFHHMEGLVKRIQHNANYHHHGHVHGDTDHVRSLMRALEIDIHHLRRDIESLAHDPYIVTPVVPHYGHVVVPGHAYPHAHKPGIHIGPHGVHFKSKGISLHFKKKK